MTTKELEDQVKSDLAKIVQELNGQVIKLNNRCSLVCNNNLDDDLRVVTHNASLMLEEAQNYISSYL